MSKALEANPGMTPFTHCPGTAVYMPPEGLRNPPVYTNKLDCFSFGVLGIQIMTRQFPNPGPEEQIIEDARSPSGTIKVPILDSERRKTHIDLITPNHPLLPVALHCLSYRDSDRPSAQELCDQLETLKGGPQYRHSHTQGQDQVAAQVQQAEELHQQQLRYKDAVIAAGQGREQQLREQKQQLRQELREHMAEKARYQQDTQHLIQEKDSTIEANQRQLQELHQQLQANEAVVADFQHALIQRDKEIEQLREDNSAMSRERAVERVPRQDQVASATPVATIKLKWKTGPKAPGGIVRGSSAVSSDGSRAYFCDLWNNCMYEYDMTGRWTKWAILPQCPSKYASLVVMAGLLTAVGGQSWGTPTNDLFSLTREKKVPLWTKLYPPMPTPCWYPAVVCSGNSLIVTGGCGDDTTVAVEVMDTSSLQWFTASSLPHYFNGASATLCGDSLYLMGGSKKYSTENSSPSVLTCSLTALLESRRSQSLPARMKALFTAEQFQMWKKVADAPVYFTSCTTLCGRVIAVGGNRNVSCRDHDPTHNVYQYNPTKNTWTVISHLPTPRYRCLITALPYHTILVVGGHDHRGRHSNIVEVGSVEWTNIH